MEQGRDQAGREVHADSAVADVDWRIAGLAIDPFEQRGNAGGRLQDVVVGRPAGIGSAFAEPEGATNDQAGIDGRKRLVGEPQATHGLRPDVVDQHVCLRHKRQQRVLVLGFFQVEHHAALVAVGLQEQRAHASVPERAHLAHGVTRRRLHLDDIRTKIAEDLGSEGPHHDGGEVEYANAL